ncbi:MAG: hypothetical protein VX938_10800 [Myxococcota bacterium]|nr:hypothetical protein [Myxococcota bacterium]
MIRRLAPQGVALAIVAAVAFVLSGCSGVDETLEDPASEVVDTSAPEPEGDTVVSPDGDGPEPDGVQVEEAGPTDQATWQVESLGDEDVLETIWCVSEHLAYAVGGRRVLRYNGSTWATYGTFDDLNVHGVTSDGVHTVVVGDGGFIARRAEDGLEWVQEESGTDSDLHGVFGYTSDDLWAVGSGSTVLHYVEGAWVQESGGGSVDLQSLWIPPGADMEGAIAAGSGGIVYKRHNGQWVTEQVADGSATLHGVWGVGEARYAVGSAVGDYVTISGKANSLSPWDGHNANVNKVKDLHGLTSALGDVWAVGHGGTMLRFSGGKNWEIVSLVGLYNAAAPLEDVSAAGGGPGEGILWMAISADGGGIRYDGAAWKDMETRPEEGMRAIEGPDREHLWAVGEEGLIMFLGDQGWSAFPSGTLEDLNDVAVGEDGTAWVAGDGATLLKVSSDGTVESVSVPVPGNLLSVSVTGDSLVVGTQGGLVLKGSSDGSELSIWNVGTTGDVRAIEPDGDGGWWFSGAFGLLTHVEAGADTGSPVAAPTSGTLFDLAVDGDRVLAVGDNGVIIEVKDDSATLLHEAPGLFLYGVSTGADAVRVVGWNGTVLREGPEGFEPEDSGTDAVLEAIWQDEEGAFAAGRLGSVLVRTEAP